MGLGDLIRKVHSNESVSAAIDHFLMKQEATPKKRAFGWHPSEFVGMCPRARVLSILLKVPYKPIDPGLRRIFDVGSAIHHTYQNYYFGPMGDLWGKWICLRCDRVVWGFYPGSKSCPECRDKTQWRFLEVPVKAPLPDGFKKPIVGHSDGLLLFNGKWHVLEIKSINDHGFSWLKKPKDSYQAQAQVYAELIRQNFIDFGEDQKPDMIPEIEAILIFYVNKNFSTEREFFLEFDRDFAHSEMKRPLAVEIGFRNRELPPRESRCKNMLRKPAKDCPLVSYCFGGMSWEQLSRAQGRI